VSYGPNKEYAVDKGKKRLAVSDVPILLCSGVDGLE